jgi:cytochrome P450
MSATTSSLEFDPHSPEFLIDPQLSLQPFLQEGPVRFHERSAGYYVIGYEAVRSVLGDDTTFSSVNYQSVPIRDALRARIPDEQLQFGQIIQGNQLPNMDAPAHVPQRRALQQTFTRKRVQQRSVDIERIANELLDELEGRGACDLIQDFASRLTVRVVARMLGVPDDLVPGFQAWINDVFRTLAPIEWTPEDVTTPDDQLVATYANVWKAFAVYSELLEQRRRDPADDLISALLALQDDAGRPFLSTDKVLAHMVGITAAGTDTTANLIVNTVRLFTRHPDQLALVLEDPALWENAVAEALRRSTIVFQAGRLSTRDAEVAGVRIPARSRVSVMIPGANADPAKWADPLDFDVRRPGLTEIVSFGRGRHFCLGSPLARPEARIALTALYRRLPNLRADLDQPLEFVTPSLAVRAQTSQRVTWDAPA